MLAPDTLEDALATLGAILSDRGEAASLAIVGGGALLLAGHIRRPTKDVDVVAVVREEELLTARPLPPSVATAVKDVAAALDLESDWLNPGPTDTLQFGLPSGFLSRCEHRHFGTLELFIASRKDQIALKLYAAADHWPARINKHLDDLGRLQPNTEELRWAAAWCQTHDPSEGFATMQLGPVLSTFGATDD